MLSISRINTAAFKGVNTLKPCQCGQQQGQNTSIQASPSQDKDTIHTSWFYINDIHGKMTKMERIYNISKEFDNVCPKKLTHNFFTSAYGPDIARFKVSSGDILIGSNPKNNKVASNFLDWCEVTASALGNHEVDIVDPDKLSELLENAKYKMLGANIELKPNSHLNGKILPSIIMEKNGEKYGVIGIAPSDILERVKMNPTLASMHVQDIDKTIETVQKEIDAIKSQGINKIILLSHSGYPNDLRIAKETDGIDIIFGAHTHDLIKNITEKNLLYSKSGEPVIITQAGKNAEYVGLLNVDFDKNGIIKKVQNNIISTAPYNRPLGVKDSVEAIIGKPEIVGHVKSSDQPPKHVLIEDNPHGDLLVDAMRVELGTDIALLNAGNIRGHFNPGPVDTRLLSDISPFEDKMMVLSLSEKQIVDAIKHGCKSVPTNTMPGLMLVSGLKYTCNKHGELLSLEFTDKANKVHKIDINNPSETKKYTVATDDFLATGGDGYFPVNHNPNYVLKTYDFDKDKLAASYIKKMTQPFEVKHDGRIKIVD